MRRTIHMMVCGAWLLTGCSQVAKHEALSPRVESIVIRPAEQDEVGRWKIIDDSYTFGRSTAAFDAGTFHGTVRKSLAGGWASVRRPLDAPLDLGADGVVMLRVRGDGHRYGFDLRDRDALGGTYWEAPFVAGPEWQEVEFHRKDFVPLAMGMVTTPDHDLNTGDIRSFALVVGNGELGPFRLEVESILVTADQRKSQP